MMLNFISGQDFPAHILIKKNEQELHKNYLQANRSKSIEIECEKGDVLEISFVFKGFLIRMLIESILQVFFICLDMKEESAEFTNKNFIVSRIKVRENEQCIDIRYFDKNFPCAKRKINMGLVETKNVEKEYFLDEEKIFRRSIKDYIQLFISMSIMVFPMYILLFYYVVEKRKELILGIILVLNVVFIFFIMIDRKGGEEQKKLLKKIKKDLQDM